MSTISTSTSSSQPTSRKYDTGFPDSFAEWTTSQRHPDAIVSPDYSISAEDVDPSKTLQRSKRSLLSKHKRTISHGRIPQGHAYQAPIHQNHSTVSMLPSIDSAIDVADPVKEEAYSPRDSFGRYSKDGTEDTDRVRNDFPANESYLSKQIPPLTTEDVGDGRRRSKLFKRWRTQKD